MADFALEENGRRICELEILITRQEMRIAKLQTDGRALAVSACQLLNTYRVELETAWVHRRLLQSK